MNLATEHANAAPGATIRVPAGQHGPQTLTLAKPVTFVADPGAELGDVRLAEGCAGIELDGFKVGRVRVGDASANSKAPVKDIVLRRLDGIKFQIGWSERVSVLSGDWGPMHNEEPPWVVAFHSDHRIPTDILIEDNHIHDITMVSGGVHVEGVLVWAGNGVTIRKNRFARCGGTGDIAVFWLHLNPPNPQPILCNVLVEENLGSIETGYAWFNMQVDRELLQTQNVIIRGNTFPRKPNNAAERGPDGCFLTSWPTGNKTMLQPPAGWPRTMDPPEPPPPVALEPPLPVAATYWKLYEKANPKEAAAIVAYWAGGERPEAKTLWGRFLVGVADQLR